MSAAQFTLLLGALTLHQAQAQPTASGACPAGWSQYNNHCFRASSTEMDRDMCAAECNADNAWIACVESKYENAWIVKNIAPIESNYLWLGYNDLSREGDFAAPEQCEFGRTSYTNWAPGEPNSGSTFDCAVMATNVNSAGYWYDQSCSAEARHFCLCQLNVASPVPTVESPWIVDDCPEGWVQYENACYRLSDTMTKFSCEIECSPGFLACIDNEDENDWIVKTFAPTAVSSFAFLAYSDYFSEGNFRAPAECNFDRFSFTKYMPGEPNSGSTVDCVVINMLSDPVGYWRDATCTNNYHCLCKLILGTPAPAKNRLSESPSMSPAPTTSAAPTTGSCPDGWVQYKDHCYRISTNPMSKFQCEVECSPGWVACIDDADENDWVVKTFEPIMTSSFAFLGYSDYFSEGNFRTPTECGPFNRFSYTKWDPVSQIVGALLTVPSSISLPILSATGKTQVAPLRTSASASWRRRRIYRQFRQHQLQRLLPRQPLLQHLTYVRRVGWSTKTSVSAYPSQYHPNFIVR